LGKKDMQPYTTYSSAKNFVGVKGDCNEIRRDDSDPPMDDGRTKIYIRRIPALQTDREEDTRSDSI
jgi:hypothetical protein